MTNIEDVRAALMSTLADLRNRKNPMEVDRARAIAQVSSVIIDSARVEVDFLRATKRSTSAFLTDQTVTTRQTRDGTVTMFPGGVTQHRLGGEV